MMQGPDLEVLKEIPGYHAIVKAVLKSQIQLLVEQLADQAGEEAVVLTASINDGTLSHLGSETGKVFLEGHDEIKSQFLGFCLNRHHKRKLEESTPSKQSPPTKQPKRFSSHQIHTVRSDEHSNTSSPTITSASTFRRGRNAFSINHIAKNLRERSSPVTVKSLPTAVPLTKFSQEGENVRDQKPFISPSPAEDNSSYDSHTPHVAWDGTTDKGDYPGSLSGMDNNSAGPVVIKLEKEDSEGFATNNIDTGVMAEGSQMSETDWASGSYNSGVQGEAEMYDQEDQSNNKIVVSGNNNLGGRGGNQNSTDRRITSPTTVHNIRAGISTVSPSNDLHDMEDQVKSETMNYTVYDASMANQWPSPGQKSEGELVGRGFGRVEKLIKCDVCSHVCRTSNMARHKKRYCMAVKSESFAMHTTPPSNTPPSQFTGADTASPQESFCMGVKSESFSVHATPPSNTSQSQFTGADTAIHTTPPSNTPPSQFTGADTASPQDYCL